MLRAGLERPGHAAASRAEGLALADVDPLPGRQWRVSSGSAAVLGLRPLIMDAAPTTAYLMVGERCLRNCAFCAQARESRAPIEALSRVMWPPFEAARVASAVASAFERREIVRACFQVTAADGALKAAEEGVKALAATTPVPISMSVVPRDLENVGELLRSGAERVTIALDAATPAVYHRVKGGTWKRTWDLLTGSAGRFPGHIGTHLIVGLGETEREMVTVIQRLADMGITIGLFAFTPVSGTAMAEVAPPPLDSYRRVQAARWLIVHGLGRAEGFAFNDADRLASYGLGGRELCHILAGGDAFRTAGCPGCNRPYYNERPGGPMYNYPRPLAMAEAEREVAGLVASLRDRP